MRRDRRGVIIPNVRTIGKFVIANDPEYRAALIRHALFYFDKIDMPYCILHIPLSDDENFLASCNILQTSQVKVRGGKPIETVSQTLEQAFLEHDKSQPGQWMIGEGQTIKNVGSGKGRALIVEFVNAIPFPTNSVPLADILEFKEKRRDELMRLRHHLEAMYDAMTQGNDRELKIRSISGTIDQDLRDISRLMKERSLLQISRNLTFKIDISSLWKQALIGGTSFEYMFEWLIPLSPPARHLV